MRQREIERVREKEIVRERYRDKDATRQIERV